MKPKSRPNNIGRLGSWMMAAVAAVTLAGCAAKEGVSTLASAECKQISAQAEAKINWARVPDVQMVIRDGEYSPMVVRLRQGRPYILRLRNRDDEMRVFRARDFFHKNAVLAVGIEGQRSEHTCFQAISIPPRQTAEVRMVAITDGTYEFEDNEILIPLVFSGGAGGAIIVEERQETAANSAN